MSPMTDRHAGYVVTLAEDIREDDAEEGVLTAIRMIRGVIAVSPVTADVAVHTGRDRADAAWRDALMRLLRDGPASNSKSQPR